MKHYSLFCLILLLAIFIGKNFSFLNHFTLISQVQADNANTSVYVCTSVCGDGVKECLEECDDGNTNDGDGCDHNCKIETTTTTTSPPSTTSTTLGGGGGGGGGYTPPETKVTFTGKAYPKSTVTLLKDAQIVATTIAGSDANFQISLSNITGGNYIFSVYSEDDKGNRSSLLTFPLSVTQGVTTNASGIFIAPTIDVDKSEVKKGDNISIFGQSVPQSDIVISINSDEEFFAKTISDKNGIYLYNFDTSMIDYGTHYTKSKASVGNQLLSNWSYLVNFKVGDKTVLKESQKTAIKADMNNDKRVNLVDFSILAYWYKRPSPPQNVDLNGDGKVDLVDFSIMAYYWTG